MSGQVDFGWWLLPNGRRRLLTWWPDCGALTLDGPGGVDVLAVTYDEDELRRRLAEWPDHCDRPEGLRWLVGQLQGHR